MTYGFTILVQDENHPLSHLHCLLHTPFQPLEILVAHRQLIDNDLHIVVTVTVKAHLGLNLTEFPIDAHIEKPLLAKRFKKFTVMSLAAFHNRTEEINTMAVVILENQVNYLFLSIFDHLLTAQVGICIGSAGIEKTYVVVDFGLGTHCRAGIAVGGLLFNRDNRAQTSNLVNVRPFQIAQKIACVCRKSLDIATLPFGKERVKGQRRLSAATQSGYYRQAVARNVNIDILQIVGPCPIHRYGIFTVHSIQAG